MWDSGVSLTGATTAHSQFPLKSTCRFSAASAYLHSCCLAGVSQPALPSRSTALLGFLSVRCLTRLVVLFDCFFNFVVVGVPCSFSAPSGCLLILDWWLSSFWLCEEVKGFYLCLYLGWNSRHPIFLIFPGHPEFWTPLQIPLLGGPWLHPVNTTTLGKLDIVLKVRCILILTSARLTHLWPEAGIAMIRAVIPWF